MKKSLLILTLLFSTLSYAAYERPCESDREACSIKSGGVNLGITRLLALNTNYARGIGVDCDQAIDNADRVYNRHFENRNCTGLFSGPHQYLHCRENANGMTEYWVQCKTNGSSYRPRSQTPRCANIMGTLVCN